MKPTMKLRWLVGYGEDLNDETRIPSHAGKHYSQELQQWWEDDEGAGEWRGIEVEYVPR